MELDYPIVIHCCGCAYWTPTDHGLGMCNRYKWIPIETDAYGYCSSAAVKIYDPYGKTFSSSSGDMEGIFIEKEETMDEKDKIIQDLRRENEKLKEANEALMESSKEIQDDYEKLLTALNDFVKRLKGEL